MVEGLREGDFDAVKARAADAERLGLRSPRLASLHAQAVREMPDPLAIRIAGRLDDFGEAIESPLFKALLPDDLGALHALQLLNEAGAGDSSDRDAFLNRAHALLRRDPAAAETAFASWLARHPDDREALSGRGLAEFLAGDFAESAATFNARLRLDPDDLNTRINFAFALERAEQLDQAMAQWREVHRRAQVSELRNRIQVRLSVLEKIRRRPRPVASPAQPIRFRIPLPGGAERGHGARPWGASRAAPAGGDRSGPRIHPGRRSGTASGSSEKNLTQLGTPRRV